MLILGIASAPSSSGWALVEVSNDGEHLVSTGRINAATGETVANLAGVMTTLPDAPEMVVVEDTRPTERAFSQVVGRWLQAFEGVGIKCATVSPALWQATMSREVHTDADRRALGSLVAERLFCTPVAEGDAACVALWAGRKRLTY
jgi:hypothetical protein